MRIYDPIVHDGKIHDYDRIDFLKSYLAYLSKAIDEGINVKGYFQWSLLDNFEWAAGYTIRFGLFYTDYKSLRRIPKESAKFYRDLIKRNSFNL